MKLSTPSSAACLIVLMAALTGTAYAQSSPADDIRESNDPARAAEVERKAEAISGQTYGGSGTREEERSEERQPSMPSDEFYGPGEDRSSGESGESEGSSGQWEEGVPSPYSPSSPEGAGDSGTEEMDEGSSGGSSEGGTDRGKVRDSGPPDMSDPYY
jgi:hypothetical protein